MENKRLILKFCKLYHNEYIIYLLIIIIINELYISSNPILGAFVTYS